MPRADELVRHDRIRHPLSGEIVEVTKVTTGLSWAKVFFKAKGQHGWFKTNPQTTLEDCA